MCWQINCTLFVWYQSLWRQNTSIFFYEVYNKFVTVFKKLLFGDNTSRLSSEAVTFINKRGTLEKMENHNVIRIFCSREILSFLPYYVSEKLFINEVARQYGFWLHFFHEKRKKAIYPVAMESSRNCVEKYEQNRWVFDLFQSFKF